MSVENKWLVKSSDTILGPYPFDQVVESIFSGEIHLLDEIKGPFERWRPIRDHSLFAAAIEKLKATTYSSKRENTMTATVDLGTQTHEMTKSAVTPASQETKTPIMTQAAVTQSIGEVNGHMPRPPQQQYQQQRRSRFSTVFALSFFILVAGGIAYLIYQLKETKLIEQKISAYGQLTDNAIGHLKTGEYQKALKNFSLAYNISPNDPNLVIEMAPLSVQFDGQFSKVQVMLEGLMVTNYQKEYVTRAQTTIGLTHSYRAQYKEALAAYDQAIKLDDQFLPALIDKAFVLIKMKRPADAVELMKKVVSDNPDEAIAHYFYIRSLVEDGMKSGDKTLLEEALSVSNEFGQKFADFKQEVLFLDILAKLNLDAPAAEIDALTKEMLMVDSELTNLHVHDTLLDFQTFNWLDYTPYCDKIINKVDPYTGQLLKGFCYLKINRTIEAKKIFEALLSQQNDDGLLQALYAASLLKMNDLSQAKNALGFINQVNEKQPVVETILRGCLSAGDLACGEAIFKGQHSKHISLLYSHWGNSEINMTRDKRKAKSSVQLGLEIAPNFAPLLKLNRKQ